MKARLVEVVRTLFQIPTGQLDLVQGGLPLRDVQDGGGDLEVIAGDRARRGDGLVRVAGEGLSHGLGVLAAEAALGIARGGIGRRGVAGGADEEAEDAAVPRLQRFREDAGVVGGVDRVVPHRRRVAGEVDQPADDGAVRPPRQEDGDLLVGGALHADEPLLPGPAVGADVAVGVDRAAVEGPTGRRHGAGAQRGRLQTGGGLRHRLAQTAEYAVHEGGDGVPILGAVRLR